MVFISENAGAKKKRGTHIAPKRGTGIPKEEDTASPRYTMIA